MDKQRIYNADLLEAIHKIDKRMEVHITWCKTYFERIENIEKDISGNGDGIKHQHKVLWEEREEKKDIGKEIKIAIVLSVFSAVGSLLNIVF